MFIDYVFKYHFVGMIFETLNSKFFKVPEIFQMLIKCMRLFLG